MVDVLEGSVSHADVGERAIGVLADVPPHDGFWDDIETFVERIRGLASAKLSARELKRREEELRRALGSLHHLGLDTLAFHEAVDVMEWTVEDFDAGAWVTVAETCVELDERLVRHATLQADQPSNRTAARARRSQLDALEEEIAARLDRVRAVRVSHPPAAAAATHEAPAAQTTAAAVPHESEPADLHAPLDADGEHYSVFTLAEERRLTEPRAGVCLVFASMASGLDAVPQSIANLARRAEPVVEVPESVAPEAIGEWVRNHAARSGRVLAWQRLGRWSSGLEAGLRRLVDRRGDDGVRIVLTGGPADARAFVSIDPKNDLPARLDAVIGCGRWPLPAIERRLRDDRLDDGGAQAAAAILAATRGWHRLLEVMWTRKAVQRGLEAMIDGFNATFRSPGGYSGFRAALGLGAFPDAETVFVAIAQRGGEPMPLDAARRWISAAAPAIGSDVVRQALDYLSMLQVIEIAADRTVRVDPIAREVVTSAE